MRWSSCTRKKRVVVLGRAEEEAVGGPDPVVEGLDGGREPAVGRLEVGVDQRQGGDVDVLHAHTRDRLLAHLRRWRRGNDAKISGRAVARRRVGESVGT